DIEQAVIAPAEIIRRHGRGVGPRLLLQPLIGIEGMLFALELLLVGELLARRRDLVLRPDMGSFGTGRFGARLVAGRSRTRKAPADASDLDARHEAFEIALLLVAEIAAAGRS